MLNGYDRPEVALQGATARQQPARVWTKTHTLTAGKSHSSSAASQRLKLTRWLQGSHVTFSSATDIWSVSIWIILSTEVRLYILFITREDHNALYSVA